MKKLLPLLLGLNLFFLQSYLIRFSVGPYPSNLQEVLIGLMTLALVLVKGPRELLLRFLKARVLLIGAGLSILSLVWMPLLSSVDGLRFAKFVFFASLLVLAFVTIYRSKAEQKQGLKWLSYGALSFGLFSALYNGLGYNVMPDGRLAGPLDSAVYLAVYLIPPFLFFLKEWAAEPRRFGRITPVAVTGILLLATRSFGAIGGALAVSGLYALYSSSLPFLRKACFRAALLLLAMIFGLAAFYVKILPTLQTNYSSLDERGEIWQTAAALLEEPKHFVLGLGLGQFQPYYEARVEGVLGRPPLDFVVLQPHNVFLLLWVNYGLAGLLAALALLGCTLWTIFKEKPKEGVRLFAAYIVLYFFVHGMIDTPWFKNDLLFYVLLFSQLSFEEA